MSTFSFGTPTNTASTTPSFGFNTQASPAKPAAFTFGTTASTTTTTTTAASTNSFTFGNTQASPAKPAAFTFGTQASATSTPSFTFGSSQTTSTTTTPSFSFGGQSTTQGTSQTFNFSTPSNANTGAFQGFGNAQGDSIHSIHAKFFS